MRILINEFVGQFAAPDHPNTCANPAPWRIDEMRIEVNPFKVWIRNSGENGSGGSMWFRADQCMIGTREELEEFLAIRNQRKPSVEVTDIRICKLPYQDHPFVHGVRDGKDVWLTNNGEWTEIDGHQGASIQLRDGLEIKENSHG